MALNFPSTPSANTTYTFNNKTWTYNGNVWTLSYGTLNTGVVPEGSNQYFTNARARASITVSGSGTYDPNTGVITISQSSNYGDSNVALLGYATNANVALKANTADLKTANVAELTNLYFTNARARTVSPVQAPMIILQVLLQLQEEYHLLTGRQELHLDLLQLQILYRNLPPPRLLN